MSKPCPHCHKEIEDRSFTIPKEHKWTKEDFVDLYETMIAFKKRFMERRSCQK